MNLTEMSNQGSEVCRYSGANFSQWNPAAPYCKNIYLLIVDMGINYTVSAYNEFPEGRDVGFRHNSAGCGKCL